MLNSRVFVVVLEEAAYLVTDGTVADANNISIHIFYHPYTQLCDVGHSLSTLVYILCLSYNIKSRSAYT